ncbi:hypothetical protein [Streptomyces misionensis]|uniref:hypothetical protein n=1 Tax=Streptomyces misionensis TaxID=67331 RepID=UPI0036CE8E1E
MPVTQQQKQEWVRLHRSFLFHQRHLFHDKFQVTITDSQGVFQYQVRGWTHLIRTVEAFTETIAMPGAALIAKVQLYQVGEAELNGYVIRAEPLS